jgi:hypothetical protein
MLNVSFTFTGYQNGRPYWTSNEYSMKIIWNGTYWEIENWPYDGTPVNYTDTDIPLTGWQLINNTSMTATFNVNLGECCFEYSFINEHPRFYINYRIFDCGSEYQYVKVPFGISGSFCATSIIASSDTGSYSLTGDLCSNPDTTCRGWVLTGPVTVYYTDCNGIPRNTTTVADGEF